MAQLTARPHPSDQGADREVVQAAQAGDAGAWEVLFDQHYPRLYRFFRPRVASDADAEDLAAESFVDAYRGLPRYRWRDRPFGAWMFAIGRNRLRMYYRAQKVTVPLHEGWDGGGRHLAQDDHLGVEVRDALERLQPEYRLVLELRYLLDLSGEEAAAVMGKSHPATRKLLQRASAAFRAAYGIDR